VSFYASGLCLTFAEKFMSDSLGKQFMGIIAEALSQKRFSKMH